MTTAEFSQQNADSRQSSLIVLDARTEAEYQVSHLQEAKLLDTSETNLILSQVLNEVSKDIPIIVYCSVGYRSAKVVKKLWAAGFRQVFNLEGGLFQWSNEDRPVFQGEQVTHQVHPYNALWGHLLKYKASERGSGVDQ